MLKYVMRRIRPLLISLLFFIPSVMFLNPVSAKDIKDEVIKRTSLDEQIVVFCLRNCKGNERKGYLKSFTVDRMKNGLYRVVGKAALQNRQVVRRPFEFVVYDHTVIVNTLGTLNPDNCKLRIDDVFVENDYHNIFTTMLQNHGNVVGKVEKIPNCQRFID
jgi:hypothetical protein